MSTVSMQRGTSSVPQKPPQYGPPGPAPQFAPAGGAPQQFGAPPPQQYGAPQQQFNMAGGPPPQRTPSPTFNMAGGPPPPYASAPTQQYPPPQQQYAPPPTNSFNAPPPNNMYNSQPPYASTPLPGYGGAPQQYPTQQPYGNPPLQQFGSQQGGFVGSVSLAKGGNMSLTKANPNLSKIRIGLGWDVRQTGGPAFDLDASAFMLKGDGHVRMPQDLIFYNNKTSVDGSVYHHGDNLTGAGEGDDEIVSIDLTRVPPEIQKVVFTCSIYEAEVRQQNFGMVSRAFIRVVDDLTNQEICRFDLTEEASLLNSMIFGEVYKYGNEWKFRAVGQGIQGGLKAIGGMFGLNLV